MKDFITHLVPTSIVDGMARNEILQIVVFSVFFGTAAAAVGARATPMIDAIDGVAHVMLKVTGYVMNFAPIAVFAAVSGIIAKSGLGVLSTYGIFMAEFYFGIALLWVVLIRHRHDLPRPARPAPDRRTARARPCWPSRPPRPKRPSRKPWKAWSASASRTAWPSFVLPIGYSFNLDGSMMYCTFAAVFIAQAYGIELSLGTQITMMLVLMLTSKGMAGVPRASLVVIAATLTQFDIPEAGLLLLLGDRPLPGHGPLGHQRHRQRHRHRRRRQVGGRARGAERRTRHFTAALGAAGIA